MPWPHSSPIVKLFVSPDGKNVVTLAGRTFQLWDVASDKVVGAPVGLTILGLGGLLVEFLRK